MADQRRGPVATDRAKLRPRRPPSKPPTQSSAVALAGCTAPEKPTQPSAKDLRRDAEDLERTSEQGTPTTGTTTRNTSAARGAVQWMADQRRGASEYDQSKATITPPHAQATKPQALRPLHWRVARPPRNRHNRARKTHAATRRLQIGRPRLAPEGLVQRFRMTSAARGAVQQGANQRRRARQRLNELKDSADGRTRQGRAALRPLHWRVMPTPRVIRP